MNNQQQTSGSPNRTAKAQDGQESGEDKGSPPDKIRGESAAKRQKGQPGLPVSDKKVWSPGSDLEKSRI